MGTSFVDKDKISKMITHRQQQQAKNERNRMHRNKIEKDRLSVTMKYIDWSKSNYFRKIIFKLSLSKCLFLFISHFF